VRRRPERPNEQLPDAMIGFVRALKTAGCDVALLYGRQDQKVVDLGILKLMEAIRTQRPKAAVASSATTAPTSRTPCASCSRRSGAWPSSGCAST
jgi:hypothetical protein